MFEGPRSLSRRRLVQSVGATSIAAVTPRQARAAIAPRQTSGNGTINLTFSTDWNSPYRKAPLDLMKEEFEQANPDVSIEHWHMGSGGTSGPGGYTDIVVAQLLTGSGADLIGQFFWGPYVDHLVDLTEDAPAAGWNQEDVILNEFDQFIDGRLYMLSMHTAVGGWAYNKTMFQEAGIDEPDDSWTWDTVLEAAQELTQPDKQQYGIMAPNRIFFAWLELVWAAGAGLTSETTAQMFDLEQRKSLLGEAGGPDAFTWYIDLIYKHKVAPTPGEIQSLAGGAATDPFAAGRIGMTPFPMYGSGDTARQIGDRFQWSIMPIPQHPQTGRRARIFSSDGIVIPKYTQERGTYEMALKYAVSFYSDPVQRMIAAQRSTLPTVRTWIESPEYLDPPPDNLDVIVNTINDPQVIVGDFQQRYKEFGLWTQAVQRETDRAFTGETPPQEAFAAAMAAGDEALASA